MSLKDLTLQELIDMALTKVDTEVDRRTGSIIYDTIASAAVPMQFIALEGASIEDATYMPTSYGPYVDKRAAEQGMSRLEATAALKKGVFTDQNGPTEVPVGTRFSTIDNANPLVYVIQDVTDIKGTYILQCESNGSIGNAYYGKLLPISYINTLSSAEITGDYRVARDEETDEELKARYFAAVRRTPFGGNISQYEEEVKKIQGVGDLQVHRAYPSSGHISISIIGTNRRKITSDFINELQEVIDPGEEGTGLGLAPIFHRVRISTPSEVEIPISFDLTVLNGYTVEQLEPLIRQRLEDMFTQLRRDWGILDARLLVYSTIIYISRIIVSVSAILGVANISNVKINGQAEDMMLKEAGDRQELPMLGVISINE